MTKKNLEIRKKILSNYALMLVDCDKMKHHPEINLKQLQRTLRPFCKTVLSDGLHLHLRLKETEVSISIQLIRPYSFQQAHYFRIVSSNYRLTSIELSALNTRELMHKINHKFELLKPFQND
jgi:hypothetical protein